MAVPRWNSSPSYVSCHVKHQQQVGDLFRLCRQLYPQVKHLTSIINGRLYNVYGNGTRTRNGLYVEIKCQLDATEVFIADIIACSTCFGHHCAHHQEPKSIIQWLLPVVFRAVVFKLLFWCGAEGYVSGLQDACWFNQQASCKSDP